jgi:hypothetical protein
MYMICNTRHWSKEKKPDARKTENGYQRFLKYSVKFILRDSGISGDYFKLKEYTVVT